MATIHKFDGGLELHTSDGVNKLFHQGRVVTKKSDLDAVGTIHLAQLVVHFVMPIDDVVHHLGLELK